LDIFDINDACQMGFSDSSGQGDQ